MDRHSSDDDIDSHLGNPANQRWNLAQMQRVPPSTKPLRAVRIELLALIAAIGLLALEPIVGLVAVLLLVCVLSSLTIVAAILLRRSTFGKFALTKGMLLFCAIAWSFFMAELAATLYFADLSNGLETVRVYFSGGSPPTKQFVGQPYLLYAPRPGQYGANYHNEQGYRGKAVSMQRQPGIARVLCLGGSTTYGYSVKNPDDTYPAHLERILQSQLPAGFSGVEVINGGLLFATTAELVTHYHFKFQYFLPDVVVINTGGNDAGFADTSAEDTSQYYQPDYSHHRQNLVVPQRLSLPGRVLVRSRFLSWIVTLFIYGENPPSSAIVRSDETEPPPTTWHPAAQQAGLVRSLQDDDLAFTRNLRRLVDMCRADGAKVLLVPFRLAPPAEEWPTSKAERRMEKILKDIAEQRDVALAPFPAAVIAPENWADDYCHLTADGCRQKAEHLAPFVVQLLKRSLEMQND